MEIFNANKYKFPLRIKEVNDTFYIQRKILFWFNVKNEGIGRYIPMCYPSLQEARKHIKRLNHIDKVRIWDAYE